MCIFYAANCLTFVHIYNMNCMFVYVTQRWSNFLQQIYIDNTTNVAIANVDGDAQPGTVSSVESMIAALDYIAQLNQLNGCFTYANSCLIPYVHYSDKDEELGNELLQAALEHPHPPVVFSRQYETSDPELINNQTLVVTFDEQDDIVSHLLVHVDVVDWTITNYTFVTIDLENLPFEYKDDEYVQDMIFLRGLADEALRNDPVVGTSGLMPFTRIDDWRMCMGGECPIGNLYTDAIRWFSDADFAVMASGGLRGEGWGAGYVRVSDLWGALPFLNHMCTGTMSGVSVFKLLNYSTAVATFESTYTAMGDRLLQMSGEEMVDYFRPCGLHKLIYAFRCLFTIKC